MAAMVRVVPALLPASNQELSQAEQWEKSVAMSPPMFKPTWEWRILPIAKHFIRWYTIGGGLDPSTYQPPYTVKAYPKVATSNLGEFLKLVSEIRRVAPKITIPILLMQGDLDGIAPSSSGDELLDILGSDNKELKHYPKSNHVLPVDSDRKQVWEDIQKFIDKQK